MVAFARPKVCCSYQSETVTLVSSTAVVPSTFTNLMGLAVEDELVVLVNEHLAPSPAVDIPAIALSTVIVLAPIPITVVPVETTELPPVTVTMSPSAISAVATAF